MSTRSSFWIPSLAACLALAGCLQDNPAPGSEPDTSQPEVTVDASDVSPDLCGSGTPIDVDGTTVCVFPATETGFSCPPDMFPFFGGGWAACSPDEGMNGEDIDKAIFGSGGLPCGGLKVDVLLVVDNSTSMCEEQNALAQAFKSFSTTLQGYDADIRVAATSVDMQCDVDDKTARASKGLFNSHAATVFPASCMISERVECTSDADCAIAMGASQRDGGDWSCTTQPLQECIVNPNGSVNTICRFKAESDSQCVERYGRGTEFLQVGGDPDDWGCIRNPVTTACPDPVGPVLSGDQLDQVRCISTVGVYAQKCFEYEQGLGAAWAALDPSGPNSAQALTFLRDDAILVLVFVSDEDDCTTADGEFVKEDEFNTCAFLPDSTQGGPLEPVAALADKYRSLKSDPAMVKVLAIAGDSLAATEDARELDREAYRESKLDPRVCHQKSYICDGDTGIADWGSRYQALVEEFGSSGLMHNICDFGDLGGAFEGLVDTVKAGYVESCGPPVP